MSLPSRRVLVASILASVLLTAAVVSSSTSAASGTQYLGGVANDVFSLGLVGTAVYEGAITTAPTTPTSFLVFSGQVADSPESIADMTAELTALKAAGGTIFRFTAPWPSLETDPVGAGGAPSWNPVNVDRVTAVLDVAQELGLKVIFNLNNTPCHRSSGPVTDCTKFSAGWSTYPPQNMNDLAAAAKKVADTWGDKIYALEVWNEPNEQGYFLSQLDQCDNADPSRQFGPGPDATRAAQYVPMVQAAWNGVKASSHPNVLVVAGAIGLSDTTFLQDMYNDGVAGYYDAISVHPYQLQFTWSPPRTSCSQHPKLIWTTQDPNVPFSDPFFSFKTGVQAMHDTMVSNGDTTHPLFLTEFGFPSCIAAPAALQAEPGIAQNTSSIDYTGYCQGPVNQASWDAESLKMVKGWPYVGAATLFQMRDGILSTPYSLGSYGLLTHPFAPKPSYASVEGALGGP
jgi:hypothetical protein